MKLSKMVKNHALRMKRAGFTYEIAPFYCVLWNADDSVLLQGDDFIGVMSEIEALDNTLDNTLDNSEVTYEEIVLYVLEPYSVLFE